MWLNLLILFFNILISDQDSRSFIGDNFISNKCDKLINEKRWFLFGPDVLVRSIGSVPISSVMVGLLYWLDNLSRKGWASLKRRSVQN
jgi:hypothetical protein